MICVRSLLASIDAGRLLLTVRLVPNIRSTRTVAHSTSTVLYTARTIPCLIVPGRDCRILHRRRSRMRPGAPLSNVRMEAPMSGRRRRRFRLMEPPIPAVTADFHILRGIRRVGNRVVNVPAMLVFRHRALFIVHRADLLRFRPPPPHFLFGNLAFCDATFVRFDSCLASFFVRRRRLHPLVDPSVARFAEHPQITRSFTT